MYLHRKETYINLLKYIIPHKNKKYVNIHFYKIVHVYIS